MLKLPLNVKYLDISSIIKGKFKFIDFILLMKKPTLFYFPKSLLLFSKTDLLEMYISGMDNAGAAIC